MNKNGSSRRQETRGSQWDGLDLVCFSHLRWDFVYQRPQHLMSRFGKIMRVFFVEEPRFSSSPAHLEIRDAAPGVKAVVPFLMDGASKEQQSADHKALIDELAARYTLENPVLWYYTPMALSFSQQLPASLVVYDCMDDLSSFNGAPKKLKDYESQLLAAADLVFTGGQSLYEAIRGRHARIYPFPSSIDREHFMNARQAGPDPLDQAVIPHPRLGFFGVIDERMDLGLVQAIAETRPDWHLVLVGPVAKIEPKDLPRSKNIHYLGMKSYEELPRYLSGWDVAILPFALNQATRFISPTKTPEYLAGGKPVISTPIRDVVRPYGDEGLVWIAETAAQFIHAVESALAMNGNKAPWQKKVDEFLAGLSWDQTWGRMLALMETALDAQKGLAAVAVDISLPEGNAAESIAFPVTHGGAPVSVRKKSAFDYLIVGAGFAGSVLAERLASGSGKKVLVIDKRNHVAGNAYDHYDAAGILVHKYGPHIFHTNSREVFTYLSRFTKWRPYEHRVRASVDGQLVPIPINLDTINAIYGLKLSSFELEKFFESMAEPVSQIVTSEDVVVNKIGRPLYEKFFRNYTRKQWDLDPSELDAAVTSRVPIRMNRDDRYFTDVYQAMPLYGYTRMFDNILDHPNIRVMLNTEYQEISDYVSFNELIFTGPVDEFLNYAYGKLPYRSLQFQFETLDQELHQPVAVINYPNEHPYTRVTEFKHLTGQVHPKTTLVYEYPCAEGDPYYPIPRPENAERYRKYKALAETIPGVYFAGRLATYKYYNMDQVCAQALTLYARIAGTHRAEATIARQPVLYPVDLPAPLTSAKDDQR